MTKEEIAVLGHAFFDGNTLEFKEESVHWYTYNGRNCPDFTDGEWRIKPEEPKKEVWCTFRSEDGYTTVGVKGTKAFDNLIEDTYYTHIPSLDQEVELP